MYDELPRTRAEAKATKSKWYFTGKPCPRGHIDKRFTSQGSCASCLRENAMKDYVHVTNKRRKSVDTASFIKEAQKVHSDIYDYSHVRYESAKTHVIIHCHTHGAFKQSPTNHLTGKGCPKCADVRTGARCKHSNEVFIENAVAAWGNRYDYSQVNYSGAHTHVTIICPTHGPFTQTPTNHLSNKEGCSKCNHMKSEPEEQVRDFMAIFVPTVWREKNIIKPKELDIYLPDQNLAIEYCGNHHHSAGDIEHEKKLHHKHITKHKLAAEQGVRLITIWGSEWDERQFAVKRLLRCAVGKLKGKLMARKCELRTVPHPEAVAFYDRYHPQGGAGQGMHYGLYWKGKLVACMRFTRGANDRGAAKSRDWTLTRYATRVTVAGGASRLFKAFVREHNPKKVKSFSDNRYFSGGMYEQLGFVLEQETPADYTVWHQKLGLRPKSAWQRRNIPARAKELGLELDFDPVSSPETERDMTFMLGARRLYDCGKKRWVWVA